MNDLCVFVRQFGVVRQQWYVSWLTIWNQRISNGCHLSECDEFIAFYEQVKTSSNLLIFQLTHAHLGQQPFSSGGKAVGCPSDHFNRYFALFMYQPTFYDHVYHLTSIPDRGHVYTIMCCAFQRTLTTFSPPSSMQSIAIPLRFARYKCKTVHREAVTCKPYKLHCGPCCCACFQFIKM